MCPDLFCLVHYCGMNDECMETDLIIFILGIKHDTIFNCDYNMENKITPFLILYLM